MAGKTRAQRLKQVFGIAIKTCEQGCGAVKVIASIAKLSG